MTGPTRSTLRRELEEALHGVHGFCADCSEQRVLVPIDQDSLEWCCVRCGAAFVSWQRWTAPAGSRAPSQVA
jgi:hypothetical protein